MTTPMITVPCWDVLVWNGHWQRRSSHSTLQAAQQECAAGQRRDPRARLRITQRERRIASYSQPHAPTPTQRFREQQADKMAIRRQALAYYKSGSNGTEVPQLPVEEIE